MQFRRVSGRDSAQVVTPFVQVGTYPTRNFAENDCYVRSNLHDRRADHFCQPPYVAAGLGPSLPLVERAGVWSLRIRRDRRLGFPAGFPHPRIVTVHQVSGRVARDTRVFQHIAGCAPHHR